jgi:murein DD-endopeptidase MepM/ murein hydrolase activator NlpD
MFYRGIATLTGLIATVAVCSGYVLTSSAAPDRAAIDGKESLALAPLSLGNPIAVPGIATLSPEATAAAPKPAKPEFVTQSVTLGNGDTLAEVLLRNGIEGTDAHAAITAFAKAYNPRKLRKGDELAIAFRPHGAADADATVTPGTFLGFKYNVSPEREVSVRRDGDGSFESRERARPISRQAMRAEGVIMSSLYVAGKNLGIDDATLAELIRLFSWDVDFQRDIRKDDEFQVMFNRISDEDGQVIGSGEVLYASLTLSGKKKAIYRFKGDDGHTEYFDKEGRSAQKAFMRTPIDGARLSSGFGQRRHPILGYNKMHRGVDFAAPSGTPIYAAGNGTIVFAGRKGGYGNYIRIRHNGNYETAYAHMTGFARGMRTGRRVNQGQVIGYVGTTGRSTGPHLHYEVLRQGQQVNPMRIRMPSRRTLAGAESKRFQGLRAALDQRYALLPRLTGKLASN